MELERVYSADTCGSQARKRDRTEEDVQLSPPWKRGRFISSVPVGTEWLGSTYLSLSASAWDFPEKALCSRVKQVFAPSG